MSLALKFWGPMTITFNDITTGSKAYSGIKRDTITINEETLADRFEIEDGSAIDTEAGRRVVVEGDISDIVPADFDTIEGYAGDFTVLFTGPNKTLTLQGSATQPNTTHVSLVDGKMHFKVMGNWPLGTNHASVFAVG